MIRFLNICAIMVLLGSAVYAYSIKYKTLYFSAQIEKAKHEIEREQVAIGLLRAEWAHLTRPERLQELAQRHLELLPLSLSQIIRLQDLPKRPPQENSGEGVP